MGGLSGPGDPPALDSVGAEHGAERDAHVLEDGALLDVELEVGGGRVQLAARSERAVEVDAVRRQGIGKRDPVPVGQLPQLVLVAHRAAGGGGAEERTAEAGALLVGPVDEPHRHGGPALARNASQDLRAGYDVQRPVQPAAVRNRVDVPTDQDGALGVAAQRPPVVPGLVALALERHAVEQADQPDAGGVPRVRPRHPLGARGVSRERLQLAEVRDDATGVEGHTGETRRSVGR